MKQPRSENNSTIETIRKIRLLLPDGDNNLGKRVAEIHRLVSFLENITRSAVTAQVFFYFLEHEAATPYLLQIELDIPESSAYRALRTLRKMDVVVDVFKITEHKKKGGPRAKVWALQEAQVTNIADAVRRHHRALSPKYRAAEELVQTVIQDYLERRGDLKEITQREVLAIVQKASSPFRPHDIAQIAATILHERGIKVWRR